MPAPSWTRDPEPPPDHRRRLIDSPAKIAVLAIVVALVIAGIAVGAVVAVQKASPRECVRYAERNVGFFPNCLEYR